MWVYLSYPFGPSCPAYAGGDGVTFTQTRSFCAGDGVNNIRFTSPNHIGTHFDFPKHFNKEGKTATDYQGGDFVYYQVSLLQIPMNPGEWITVEHLESKGVSRDTELLLIRTGFGEEFRNSSTYWEKSCGIAAGVADYLRKRCPYLRTIAFDFISISSMLDRQLGRKVHKEFLEGENPILIIEDADLSPLKHGRKPSLVIASPLRIEDGDGAPCTIFANLAYGNKTQKYIGQTPEEYRDTKGILLDFDGVIAETSQLKADLFLKALNQYAPHLKGTLEKTLLTELIGAERSRIAKWVVQNAGGKITEQQYLEQFTQLLYESLPGLKIRNGFENFLDLAQAKNIPVAIVSSAPTGDLVQILSTNNISSNRFTHIAGFEKGNKPRVIRQITKDWNLPCHKLIMVGDMPSDSLSARAAGVQFVRFESTHGNQTEWKELDLITIDDFADLSLILGL